MSNSSPERAALAAAIARLAEFDAAEAAHSTAVAELEQRRTDLFFKKESAADVIERAKTDAIDHLVAQARGDAGTAPPSVAEVRAQQEAIAEEFDAVDAALLTLKVRHGDLSRSLYVERVWKAAAAILADGPAFLAFHAELRDLTERLEAGAAVMLACLAAGLVPADIRKAANGGVLERWNQVAELLRIQPNHDAARPWLDVLAALMADAEAPLPDRPHAAGAEPRRGILEQFRGRKAS